MPCVRRTPRRRGRGATCVHPYVSGRYPCGYRPFYHSSSSFSAGPSKPLSRRREPKAGLPSLRNVFLRKGLSASCRKAGLRKPSRSGRRTSRQGPRPARHRSGRRDGSASRPPAHRCRRDGQKRRGRKPSLWKGRSSSSRRGRKGRCPSPPSRFTKRSARGRKGRSSCPSLRKEGRACGASSASRAAPGKGRGRKGLSASCRKAGLRKPSRSGRRTSRRGLRPARHRSGRRDGSASRPPAHRCRRGHGRAGDGSRPCGKAVLRHRDAAGRDVVLLLPRGPRNGRHGDGRGVRPARPCGRRGGLRGLVSVTGGTGEGTRPEGFVGILPEGGLAETVAVGTADIAAGASSRSSSKRGKGGVRSSRKARRPSCRGPGRQRRGARRASARWCFSWRGSRRWPSPASSASAWPPRSGMRPKSGIRMRCWRRRSASLRAT